MAAIPNWSCLAAISTTAPLFIAATAILAETDWLERLAETPIEPSAWAAISNRILTLAAASAPDALAALDEEGGAQDLMTVENRLARRFGPPAPLPAGINPMVVETATDVRVAERRLLRTLVKDTDGFMARHLERPVSLQISRRLARTAITPNQMSMISIVVGVCGGPFFLSAEPSLQTIGALMFLAHSILDGCDGELARLKFQELRWGGVLISGGQCRSHRYFWVHGAWLGRSAAAALAVVARRRGGFRHVGSAGFILLAADAPEG